jgi:hypothetical protein
VIAKGGPSGGSGVYTTGGGTTGVGLVAVSGTGGGNAISATGRGTAGGLLVEVENGPCIALSSGIVRGAICFNSTSPTTPVDGDVWREGNELRIKLPAGVFRLDMTAV